MGGVIGQSIWRCCRVGILTLKRSLGIVFFHYGGVAKLVIALACQAGDRGFEPRRSRLARPRGRAFFSIGL